MLFVAPLVFDFYAHLRHPPVFSTPLTSCLIPILPINSSPSLFHPIFSQPDREFACTRSWLCRLDWTTPRPINSCHFEPFRQVCGRDYCTVKCKGWAILFGFASYHQSTNEHYCRKDTKNLSAVNVEVFSERELTFTFAICYRRSVCLSVVCLSVCNVGAPYSAGWNFLQFFFAVWYLGHPLTSTENFTAIVLGEPLRLGV